MIFRSHSSILTKIDASTLLKKFLHMFQIDVEIKTKDIKSTKVANDKTHNGCSVYKFPTGTENIKHPVAGEIFINSEHDIPHKVSMFIYFCFVNLNLNLRLNTFMKGKLSQFPPASVEQRSLCKLQTFINTHSGHQNIHHSFIRSFVFEYCSTAFIFQN